MFRREKEQEEEGEMSKTKEVSYHLSLDPNLIKQSEALFNDLGLDLETAIRIFLKQCVYRDQIPFKIKRTSDNANKNVETNIIIDNQDDFLSGDEPAIINDLY